MPLTFSNYLWFRKNTISHFLKKLFYSFLPNILLGSILGIIIFQNKLFIFIALFFTLFIKKERLIIFIIFSFFGLIYSMIYFKNISKENKDNINKETSMSGKIVEINEASSFKESTIQVNKLKLYILTKKASIGLDIGDEINISGKLLSVDDIEQKDYAFYLKSKKIFFEVLKPNIRLIHKNSNYFFILKDKVKKTLNDSFSLDQQSILKAILFGEKNFSKEIKSELIDSGMSHIANSFYVYFSLIIALILTIKNKINKRLLLFISNISLLLFILLIGINNFSALKAFVLLSLYNTGKILGMKISKINIFLLITLTTLLDFPLSINNINFQLFIITFLSIFLFYNSINKYLEKFKLFKFIKLTISLNLAALTLLVGIIPIIFKQFSLLSIIINILLSPVIIFLIIIIFLWLLTKILTFELISLVLLPIIKFLVNIYILIAKVESKLNFDKIHYSTGLIISISLILLIVYLDFLNLKKSNLMLNYLQH